MLRAPEGFGRIDAEVEDDRALWAMAMYAGLRMGELRALQWDDVDLEAGVIRVTRSWDPVAGPVAPKSRAGVRVVPIASDLRRELIALRLRRPDTSGLVFGRSAVQPFEPKSITSRAKRVWERAGLEPIGPHECRHTFASLMIAAGVNTKALSTYMGHASITITLDRYGHLMPGNEVEAAHQLDTYLRTAVRAVEASRAERPCANAMDARHGGTT